MIMLHPSDHALQCKSWQLASPLSHSWSTHGKCWSRSWGAAHYLDGRSR